MHLPRRGAGYRSQTSSSLYTLYVCMCIMHHHTSRARDRVPLQQCQCSDAGGMHADSCRFVFPAKGAFCCMAVQGICRMSAP